MIKSLPHSPMKLAMSEHFRLQAESATTIAEEHLLVHRVCVELEALADGLPDLPGEQHLVSLAAALRAGIPAHCRHEEEEIRQRLSRLGDVSEAVKTACDFLTFEHQENDPLGDELAEALENAVEKGCAENPEALGYLVRQYFQTIRRHLMWEDYVFKYVIAQAG